MFYSWRYNLFYLLELRLQYRKLHCVKLLRNIFLDRLKKYFSEAKTYSFIPVQALSLFKFIEKKLLCKKGFTKKFDMKMNAINRWINK